MSNIVIPQVGAIGGVDTAGAVGGARQSKADGTGFSDVLRQSVDAVNNTMQEAEQSSIGLVSGQHANIHETMIAIEKASISFKLMSKVQGKVISAYQEIMRMQV